MTGDASPIQPPARVAVILARGLGTRMRREDAAAALDPRQAAAAARGLKAMIPDARGRPFLDHILASLADAGIRRAVLVVAPDHAAIRDHYEAHPPRRLELAWAVQDEPIGTADALLTAEAIVGDAPFLVCNADNLYPAAALEALVRLDRPGLVAFARDGLLAHGNIDPARVQAFALLAIDAAGDLADLVEKPDAAQFAAAGADVPVSMNLWRFDAGIFPACRAVPRSARGEFELPEAVRLAVAGGYRLHAVPSREGVLDLSARGDIASVAARLATLEATP